MEELERERFYFIAVDSWLNRFTPLCCQVAQEVELEMEPSGVNYDNFSDHIYW